MADNECYFMRQNHAWILRMLCGTSGTVGRHVFARKFLRLLRKVNKACGLGLTYIESFKLASKMAARLSFQSLSEFTVLI